MAEVGSSSAVRILRVKLNKATNLVAADYGIPGLVEGKSDPYVVLSIGEKKFKSTCISSTLNPVWGYEAFEFHLTERDMYREALIVEVYDHDLLTPDDLIGKAYIALAQFEMEQGGVVEAAWPLDIPDEFTKQNADSLLHVTVEVITGVETQDQIVETMLEFESWSLLQGWKHLSKEYTSQPPIPQGYESALGWVVTLHPFSGPDIIDDLDMNGWFYASSRNKGPWYKSTKNHPTAMYRKREWTRSFTKMRVATQYQTQEQDETIDEILHRYGLSNDTKNRARH
ncbi:hypothetical protein DYB37_003098 [Aphanomyces astaci]|uniref:C2 domain-containing protein n=1 Tax=Aphanomyces astaci TaxID=112090 RepID=A0A3R6WH36_APHAT|nr:hypothetical protein DYB35_001276 [Aphanomyces astaci]RHZ03317.1 hypothetical protein DYB37_003098 [Aphanomyces astaci]